MHPVNLLWLTGRHRSQADKAQVCRFCPLCGSLICNGCGPTRLAKTYALDLCLRQMLPKEQLHETYAITGPSAQARSPPFCSLPHRIHCYTRKLVFTSSKRQSYMHCKCCDLKYATLNSLLCIAMPPQHRDKVCTPLAQICHTLCLHSPLCSILLTTV